ncbi:MAG: methylenetetrahydrofolate reductase C-terminal domain-containing protein [Verrucomicrobia bacterium]|nr:methylenetetrahydrofolate reductase C-terminal domain-containing protein [Verrucomicrobiota bacterium]MDA1086622.1 methylenetetrahydrofolate reductase C-terminal domain-containing protein [Verrucomicrobiota bacterium]
MEPTAQQTSFQGLLDGGPFAYGVELVTTRGVPALEDGAQVVRLGEALADEPRIGWLSVTDNPGGNPMLPPDWLARMLTSRRVEIVIHMTCKDLNRNGLESAAWRYAADGFNNILALTGDYPGGGYGGRAGAVFDLDSVSLTALLAAMNDGLEVTTPKGTTDHLEPTDFYVGCAVTPFKRHERELMPQLFKLARKIHCGAEWVITQLGYDMRKFHEVKLFMQWAQVDAPLIGNVYLLNRPVARLFHQNKVPGCVVTDRLLEQTEKYAAGPDKGRAFFRELAAKQLAVFKGLGFQAGYLGGVHKAETVSEIIDMAEAFGADDWKEFAKEIQYSKDDEFYLFEQDPVTGLGDVEVLNPEYEQSLQGAGRDGGKSLGYRITRAVHDRVFTPGKGAFPWLQGLYRRLEDKDDHLALKALHRIEQVSKGMAFGCQDCGDCSLPETGYLCPRVACSKTGRNGPCGGSSDGLCERQDKECLWARAYERLKAYGENADMLKGPAVFYNSDLERTSSWANLYGGRDHHAD